jgi:hypothetical protein
MVEPHQDWELPDHCYPSLAAPPRCWQLPAEPGPEVTVVDDKDGYRWHRAGRTSGERWRYDADDRPIFLYWRELVANRGPLTDATAAGTVSR